MVAGDTLPACIRFLLDPSVYPHQTGRVELVQTHISYVLLAGEFVYKIKKPVDFGFLDFTTLAKRKHFCEQELVLNQRLCPAIYLDVVAITREGKGYALAGTGEPVEYAVKMVRLPEERMMGRVIARGELDRPLLDRIISVLEPFYSQARTGPEIDRFGTAEAVGRNVWENLQQLEPFVGCSAISREEYETLAAFARRFLDRKEIFAERIAAGRIREGHGDLYSANICLAEEVCIFDCIEFNDRFRCCDVASDVAFLAMDLDYHKLGALADYFIARFVADTKDSTLEQVLRFYKCYRATVRGKIGLLTGHEPEVDPASRQEALARATRYFALARRYAAETEDIVISG
jgi:aminoglycoside phosphotransferase family enzyme